MNFWLRYSVRTTTNTSFAWIDSLCCVQTIFVFKLLRYIDRYRYVYMCNIVYIFASNYMQRYWKGKMTKSTETERHGDGDSSRPDKNKLRILLHVSIHDPSTSFIHAMHDYYYLYVVCYHYGNAPSIIWI